MKRLERWEIEEAGRQSFAVPDASLDSLAVAAHELRTPMSGVSGLLDVLSRTPLDNEQRAMVRTMSDTVDALLRMIDATLGHAKRDAVESAATALSKDAPFDPRELIDGVLGVSSGLAHRKGLRVSVDVEPDVAGRLIGDSASLRQLLFNLIGNAIRFTEVGSIGVRVSVESGDAVRQTLAIAISDTGIGIAPHRQADVFRPFVQADSSTVRRYGGTGLGLTICRELAQRIGATLDLRSEPGVGTCVTLRATMAVCTLPDAQDRLRGLHTMKQLSPALQRRDRALAGGSLVLVADDHAVNRMLLRHRLAALGLACDVVSDGIEALAALDRTRYGCVISDCRMPRLSGYELAKRIRERERFETGDTRRMPILGITASVDQDELAACRAAGMDDCIVKPVDVERLRASLSRWFDVSVDHIEMPDTLDLARLTQSWGSPSTVKTLLETFVAAVRDDIRALQPLLDCPDAQRLLAWHHRIAGAASVLQHAPLLAALDIYRRGIETKPSDRLRADGVALAAQCDAMLDSIERQIAVLTE